MGRYREFRVKQRPEFLGGDLDSAQYRLRRDSRTADTVNLREWLAAEHVDSAKPVQPLRGHGEIGGCFPRRHDAHASQHAPGIDCDGQRDGPCETHDLRR